MKICQSCGMPMAKEEDFGKNKDGSKNEDYCIYCYPNGEFNNPDETMEEMIETCVPFMVKEGHDEKAARKYMTETLGNLKRWKQ